MSPISSQLILRRIGLKNLAVQDDSAHSCDNWFKKIRDFFQPARHGSSIDGNVQSSEDLLLAVEWQVQPKFVDSNFRKKSWTSHAFVDRLIRLTSGDHLPIALSASVLEHHVLDVFKKRLNEFSLMGDIETNNACSAVSTQVNGLNSFKVIIHDTKISHPK